MGLDLESAKAVDAPIVEQVATLRGILRDAMAAIDTLRGRIGRLEQMLEGRSLDEPTSEQVEPRTIGKGW
jgi:hypothetical protein